MHVFSSNLLLFFLYFLAAASLSWSRSVGTQVQMLNEIALLSGVVDLCRYLCIYLNVPFAAYSCLLWEFSWLNCSLLWSARITQRPLIADRVLRDRLFLGSPTVWLTWWGSAVRAVLLSSRLQSVWQFKQSLLIVDDMKVIDVGSYFWAALLGDAVSWKKRKCFYFQGQLLHLYWGYNVMRLSWNDNCLRKDRGFTLLWL